jgi:hypothetical protein
VETVSTLLHLFVYIRIYLDKKKCRKVGPPTFELFQNNLFQAKIDTQSLFSISTNLAAIAIKIGGSGQSV